MTKRQLVLYHDLDLDDLTLEEAIENLQQKIAAGIPSNSKLNIGAEDGLYCELVETREETDEEYEKRVEHEKRWAAQREKLKIEIEYKTYIALKEKFENVQLDAFL